MVSLAKRGFHPQIKDLPDGRRVIKMRKRNLNRNVAAFTCKNWEEVNQLYEKAKLGNFQVNPARPEKTENNIPDEYNLKFTKIEME